MSLEATPSSHLRNASVIFELLFDPKRWVHRRVESVSFLDDVTVRRNISVYLSVPRIGEDEREQRRQFLVPFAVFRKAGVTNLDVTNEAGHAVAILNRAQNAGIAAGLLSGAARGILGGEAPESIDRDLRMVAGGQEDRTRTWRSWERLLFDTHWPPGEEAARKA